MARFTRGVPLGSAGTMFAVYDGHGGPDCAEFVAKHLPKNMNVCAQ
jgi:serine/threonine protein phosphatase PrpC